MKNIKVITMVRNDVFLKRWVEYYGREIGKENLYIFFDGKDQEIPEFCEGTNCKLCEKMEGHVVSTEKSRSRFLSEIAAELLREGSDMVIGTDADEYLVVDPEAGLTLRELLESLPNRACFSPLGVDVIQDLNSEAPLDFNKPFLSQRHRGWLYSRYTKPSIVTMPVTWGSGFHRVKGHNFHIVEGLYLFHFGAADMKKLKEISADPSRVKGGWSRHQNKRQRAIEAVSRMKTVDWDKTVDKIRIMQSIFRPIFAPNKPTTFGLKFIVRIPSRFDNIV